MFRLSLLQARPVPFNGLSPSLWKG